MKRVHTIGYEGASIDDFIATLLLAGITHLADVRELPQSRRAGFSKNKLAERLAVEGITYTHLKALGDPKPGRDAARRGKMREFRAIYQSHMGRPEAKDALAQLANTVENTSTVLLCYERDPQDCHRSIIAASLHTKYAIEINHLGVANGAGIRYRPAAAAA